MCTSCGLFKKTFKHKEVHMETTKTEIRVSKDSTGLMTDRTTIKETTEIDTTIEIPGKNLSSDKRPSKSELQNGAITLDSAGVKVMITLDSASGILKTLVNIDPQQHHIKKKTERLENRNISEQSNTSSSNEEEKQVAIENRVKTVERTPIKMGTLVAIILGITAILGGLIWLYFWLRKRASNKAKDIF